MNKKRLAALLAVGFSIANTSFAASSLTETVNPLATKGGLAIRSAAMAVAGEKTEEKKAPAAPAAEEAKAAPLAAAKTAAPAAPAGDNMRIPSARGGIYDLGNGGTTGVVPEGNAVAAEQVRRLMEAQNLVNQASWHDNEPQIEVKETVSPAKYIEIFSSDSLFAASQNGDVVSEALYGADTEGYATLEPGVGASGFGDSSGEDNEKTSGLLYAKSQEAVEDKNSKISADAQNAAAAQEAAKDAAAGSADGKDTIITVKKGQLPAASEQTNVRGVYYAPAITRYTSPKNRKNDRKKAAGPVETKEPAAKLPVTIKSDDIQYSNVTGDFIAEGNVQLIQGTETVYTTKAVGNLQTGDIWMQEGGQIVEPLNTTQAAWGHYNLNTKSGEMVRIEGKSLTDYYSAPHAYIENGMMIMDQGGMTSRCQAVEHPQCLMVKAGTVTIIPNERIIARDVKVYMHGKHVYSRDTWVNEFGQGQDKLMPHFGYDHDNGVYARLDIEQHIGNPLFKNKTKFVASLPYYSKAHWKPYYYFRHDRKDFYIKLIPKGYLYDGEDDYLEDTNRWLKKQMTWEIGLKPHRIAKGLPLSYEAKFTKGLWSYTNKYLSGSKRFGIHKSDSREWHSELEFTINHDRIFLTGSQMSPHKTYLDLSVGRKWVHDPWWNHYSGSNRKSDRIYAERKSMNSNYLKGVLGHSFSNKYTVWLRYRREDKTSYLFTSGQPSLRTEWTPGITWRPDDRNSFYLMHRTGTWHGGKKSGDYSTTLGWVHRFCCWALSMSYRWEHYGEQDKEFKIELQFLNW